MPHAVTSDPWSQVFVLVLATFIGLGVIRRVSRLLHTPLMSITNAISAIAVVGSILVAGGDYGHDSEHSREGALVLAHNQNRAHYRDRVESIGQRHQRRMQQG